MSNPPNPAPSDLERSIRRTGKVGRFLCTTLLVLGVLFSGWLLLTVATNPAALVKLNLDEKRTAQIAEFKQAPAKFIALFETKPAEVLALANAQKEANQYQDLVDHPEKRGGTVAVIALLAVLILGFIWLVRQLFAAFAEGQVITADNARTLKRVGLITVVCGVLGLNLGIVIAGLLNLVLGWSLQQALALKVEQDLVI
jgi:cytochrome b561